MIVRSPYIHELNREGTACAPDCPACLWYYETLLEDSLIRETSFVAAESIGNQQSAH